MKRSYKKEINLSYKYVKTQEAEQVLEKTYAKLFSGIFYRRKKLKEYFQSDKYQKYYIFLEQTRSPLANFLLPIDK